jgi:hyaluronoglucosaminidase
LVLKVRRYSTVVPRPLPVRGVIEGFYGRPWAPDERLALVEFIARCHMNAYVYAPKSDPRHRDRWREPYDADELGHFSTLVERGRACGVRVGFAISPGLDVDYYDDADRAALVGKLQPMLDLGIDWVVLALDDITARPGLGRDQAALATMLLEALRTRHDGTRVSLVPTEYVGTRPTPYLCELAAHLPAEIEDVMWTGPTVCSPAIGPDDARAWRAALAGRRPLLWDNYPVNDGPMERSLHLGPYRGRPAALADELAGVLCNPMVQPWASQVPLATAAEYLADPDAYDPDAAWARALTDVGANHAPPLRALAAACADGPLNPPERLPARALVDAVVDGGGDHTISAAREHFTAARDASREWPEADEDHLRADVEPWLRQARREGKAAGAALDLLRLVTDDTPNDVDAESALMHAFGVIVSWEAARNGDRVVFGPRFAFHPAIVQLGDGRAGLDVDLAVLEDQNVVDRLCRHALAAYRAWAGAVV